MNRKSALSLVTLVILVGALLSYTQSASSNSSNLKIAMPGVLPASSNLFLPPPTTFTVTKTADTNDGVCDADCSLREAIRASNADVSANPANIDLQSSANYNLTLNNATQENAAATGDLDIVANNHTVTINGNGSTVSAAGLNGGTSRDRVFQIVSGANNVTFTDMTIADGRAADDGTSGASTNPASQNTNRFGGGILNNGGSVTLTNVTVQSCQALGKGDSVVNDHTTLDAFGGGLASVGATGNVIITGSTFTLNAAIGGNGGNFNNGAGSNASGGSIYFEGGTLNLNGSRVDNSNATGGIGGNGPGNQQNGGIGGIAKGGGAYIGAGTVTVNNSTFESCTAAGGNSGTGQNGTNAGADSSGGAMYSAGNVTLSNSTFDLNTATGGDAGDAFGPDCFGAHQAGGGGAARGGAILADAGSLIIDTATFANNSANGGNGGDGGPTNVGTCAQSEHGAGGLAHGGAITNNNAATLNIKHATISGNSAQAGNTGVNQSGATRPPRLVAEGTGGGIRVGPGSVTLENTIIAGNTAANGLGDTTGAPTPGPNVDGAVVSLGHNLIGNAAEATGFIGAGDQTGANPMLVALANNGGPTETMALSPGSPAIDAGTAAGATTDQRGMPRPVDDPGVANTGGSDGTDIGAYESAVLCSLTCPADISVSNDTNACGAAVNYTAPSGTGCGTVSCDHASGSFFGVGQTTVTCTSTAGPTCSFKVTVDDTQNPTITAPPDANYQCASQVPPASPSQATASDNCGTPTVTVSESNNGGAGSPLSPLIITRTYKATDGAGLMASVSQTITVIDNTPPTITCPANITVNAPSGSCSAVVNFTVTGNDNCSSATIVSSKASGSVFAVGTTTVVSTATDAAGNSSSCSFMVTVKDVQGPVITTNGRTITLWPPNHKYETIKITDLVASASDLCDPGVGLSSVVISKVTSDEPDNSSGDGNTTHDIVIAPDCKTVQLRSERMGGSNGRVYTITFKVTDASGNSTTATAKVTVPKSQNGSPAVDDGPHYTVTSSCP